MAPAQTIASGLDVDVPCGSNAGACVGEPIQKGDSPINADSDLAAEAAAWMLFAMYWCGASHPATLFKKSFSSADRYGAMDKSISCESAKHLCA
jgi:hypothetical protein